MMRFVSFLMIIAGVAVAFGIPAYNQFFSNFEITTQRVFTPSEGARSFNIDLAPNDSPVRFELSVDQGTAVFEPGSAVIVPVVVNTDGGTVFSSVESISSDDLSQPIIMPSFDVPVDGVYVVAFGPILDEGFVPASIDARIVGNTSDLPTDFGVLGYVLIGVGTIGFLFSGFGRKQRAKQPSAKASRGPWSQGGSTSQIGRAPPAQPKSEPAPDKPKRQWGRGEDS